MSYSAELIDALAALGHDANQHLPEAGLDPVLHKGILIRVMPKAEALEKGLTQRTRGVCPTCAKEFALGNLRQHRFGPIGRRRAWKCQP